MVKFLIQVRYSPDGLKGLIKDKASGRQAALKKAVASAGGKLECLYWALGKDDAISIVEMPDAESMAALGLAVSSTGMASTRSTRLMTAGEVDAAIDKVVKYRPPGK